jgi:hypothetical protein
LKLAERFLQLYALAHLVGGLLLPWMVGTAVFTDYNRALAQAFHVSDAATSAQAQFLTGLMGPTVASWGLLFFLLVQQAFARPTRQLWWGMVLAGLVWAPYDSFLSWQNGIYLNVVINLLSLAALLVPLLLVRDNFLNARPAETP